MRHPLLGASPPFYTAASGRPLTFSLGRAHRARPPQPRTLYPLARSFMAPKSNSTGTIEESHTIVYNNDGDPLNRYPWAKYLDEQKKSPCGVMKKRQKQPSGAWPQKKKNNKRLVRAKKKIPCFSYSYSSWPHTHGP